LQGRETLFTLVPSLKKKGPMKNPMIFSSMSIAGLILASSVPLMAKQMGTGPCGMPIVQAQTQTEETRQNQAKPNQGTTQDLDKDNKQVTEKDQDKDSKQASQKNQNTESSSDTSSTASSKN
jgi:hypothetical protein